jgi:hypothetical protein
MADYVSPGGAAASAIEGQLVAQAAQRRQAMMDRLAAQREADLAKYREQEIAAKHEEIESLRESRKNAADEKGRTNFEKRVGNMVAGDVPDPELLALDKKYGTGYFPTAATPPPQPMAGTASMAIPGGVGAESGAPVAPAGQPLMEPAPPEALAPPPQAAFVGRREDRLKAIQDAKVKEISDQMSNLDPSDPQFKVLATQYEMLTNKSLPAAFMRGAGGGDTTPVVRTNPSRNIVERLVNGKWEPVVGDVPKGAHFLQEPPPKDTSAAEARTENQRMTAHQRAVTELNTLAKPAQSHLDTIEDLGMMLNARTPAADALIAPMVLKATVSGAGTGFRMTQSEINQVVGGRSKWESLSAALNKWSSDPTKALSITDEQRTELRALAKKIRDKSYDMVQKVTKARHAIDDAKTPSEIEKIQSKLQDELNAAHVETKTDVVDVTAEAVKAALAKARGGK